MAAAFVRDLVSDDNIAKQHFKGRFFGFHSQFPRLSWIAQQMTQEFVGATLRDPS